MINIKREGIILQTTDLEFENESVMNPAVITVGDDIHMFYRAVQEGNHSTIGYCKMKSPLEVVYREKEPILSPLVECESHGVEDPRIVKIEDTYYMTYTAYDGHNAIGSLAVSKDLKHFTRIGIIASQITYSQFTKLLKKDDSPHTEKYFRAYNQRQTKTQEGNPLYLADKDLVLFPRKINGKFFFMHRIRPDIQSILIDHFEDLTPAFWEKYYSNFTDHIFFKHRYDHESSYIGAGCPPIEIDEGWLMIYHSVCDTSDGYVYSASAALLDKDDPTIEMARLPYPLITPEMDYENLGIVDKVCFPTGAIIWDDRLYIYYGAADKCIACASVSMSELIGELLNYKK
ncbi:MAG: pesticidal protein Cry7Aa [Bacteroidales bacterium]|nr:pesticidal protein Cry7Aa [Bacteroidales bacterium]